MREKSQRGWNQFQTPPARYEATGDWGGKLKRFAPTLRLRLDSSRGRCQTPGGDCRLNSESQRFLRFKLCQTDCARVSTKASNRPHWPSRAAGFESKRLSGLCVGAVFLRISMCFPHLEFFHFHHPPYGLGGWKVEFHRFFHPEFHVEKLRFPCEHFIFRVVLQVMLESTFGIEGVVARGFFKSGQLHKDRHRV